MSLFGKKKVREENPGATYLSTVYALSKSSRAWRFACIILSVAVVGLLWQYAAALRTMPVRLIPYDYAVNKDISEVTELGRSSASYLSRIAVADVSLINNWTSDTIKVQYRRFLNRCTPELYASQQVQLITKADEYSRGIRTRAFFVRDTKVIQGHIVEVTGRLKRYEGQVEVEDRMVRYRVRYRMVSGIPYIYSVNQEPL